MGVYEDQELIQRLRGCAADAECWSESYDGQRQATWLMEFANVMREAADEIGVLRRIRK